MKIIQMCRVEKLIMKYIFVIICAVVFHDDLGVNSQKFFPNLPGDFRIEYKAFIRCQIKTNNDIRLNLYLSKKSANTTEIRGNVTIGKPIDDSWTANAIFAIKDSIGGWKDNAHIFKFEKACTTIKNFLGKEWKLALNSFGAENTNCPLLPGVYVGKGKYELTNFISNSNFPKIFFYGTYKVRFFLTDKNNIEHGCGSVVVEVKRPWETD
ncbi:uncharacterized protein LOC112690089 isoform X2 [Sipha flava]|uniref:Uncharacterized protein LOC112690089 isoform X2 n=1 Tax=Sipha flava TaxID=143950 RepID=A0A8B8GAK4_9HEMI|nr:uncharacterized protein LOC112690089 isoform X2 [Sipha flava]